MEATIKGPDNLFCERLETNNKLNNVIPITFISAFISTFPRRFMPSLINHKCFLFQGQTLSTSNLGEIRSTEASDIFHFRAGCTIPRMALLFTIVVTAGQRTTTGLITRKRGRRHRMRTGASDRKCDFTTMARRMDRQHTRGAWSWMSWCK